MQREHVLHKQSGDCHMRAGVQPIAITSSADVAQDITAKNCSRSIPQGSSVQAAHRCYALPRTAATLALSALSLPAC